MIDWVMIANVAGIALLLCLLFVAGYGWVDSRRWTEIQMKRLRQTQAEMLRERDLADDLAIVVKYYVNSSTDTGTYNAQSWAMKDLGENALRRYARQRGVKEKVS